MLSVIVIGLSIHGLRKSPPKGEVGTLCVCVCVCVGGIVWVCGLHFIIQVVSPSDDVAIFPLFVLNHF